MYIGSPLKLYTLYERHFGYYSSNVIYTHILAANEIQILPQSYVTRNVIPPFTNFGYC
jgi:hypothetical protein